MAASSGRDPESWIRSRAHAILHLGMLYIDACHGTGVDCILSGEAAPFSS
jgi:hypothetical protein